MPKDVSTSPNNIMYSVRLSGFLIGTSHYERWISGDKNPAKHNLSKTLFVEHKPVIVM